eukprot:SM000155S01672  [mRNA]  locus=s155:310698:311333:- [translate_table: standard]
MLTRACAPQPCGRPPGAAAAAAARAPSSAPGARFRAGAALPPPPLTTLDLLQGSGRNKKNGNMFERWKCYDCQGFGLVKCPGCGTSGLTPEQRGER